MMACHFHSGIGSCEPHRFRYIAIIRQLLHKNPYSLEIKSREGLVFICTHTVHILKINIINQQMHLIKYNS